jgi:hypothetical protein
MTSVNRSHTGRECAKDRSQNANSLRQLRSTGLPARSHPVMPAGMMKTFV